jgi:hypothetical protein
VTTLGNVTLSALGPNWPPAITDINTGFLALVLNVLTMIVVSRVRPPQRAS